MNDIPPDVKRQRTRCFLCGTYRYAELLITTALGVRCADKAACRSKLQSRLALMDLQDGVKEDA